MANPTITVEAPRRTPREGGLFAIADVRRNVDRLINGADVDFEANVCLRPGQTYAGCWGAQTGDASKTANTGFEYDTAIVPTFAGYAGVECWLANEASVYETRAAAVLDTGESYFVESNASVLAWLNGATSSGTTGNGVAQIAQLEEIADAQYVARPVLWMSRENAQAAATSGALVRKDGVLVTAGNNTPVIASAALPSDTIYITGDVTVLVSQGVTTTAVNPPLNTRMSIAERAYTVLVDCKYRVKATIA